MDWEANLEVYSELADSLALPQKDVERPHHRDARRPVKEAVLLPPLGDGNTPAIL